MDFLILNLKPFVSESSKKGSASLRSPKESLKLCSDILLILWPKKTLWAPKQRLKLCSDILFCDIRGHCEHPKRGWNSTQISYSVTSEDIVSTERETGTLLRYPILWPQKTLWAPNDWLKLYSDTLFCKHRRHCEHHCLLPLHFSCRFH